MSNVLFKVVLLVALGGVRVFRLWATAFHATAAFFGVEFFDALLRGNESARLRVLEVGSRSVNGGLRKYAPPAWRYCGIDVSEGPGVDIVLNNSYRYPFPDAHFDAIVSISAFEHVDFFWSAFLEMLRVLKADGYIYINAPADLADHSDEVPPDSWRFLKDAAGSLARWGVWNGFSGLRVVQAFVGGEVSYQQHNDCVMIFTRRAVGLGSQVQIPQWPPATYDGIVQRTVSSTACWRAATREELSQRYVLHMPNGLIHRVGIAWYCCFSFDLLTRMPPEQLQGTVSPDQYLALRSTCWGARGRTFTSCCAL